MNDDTPQRIARLETEAIVIGYAMSRLDKTYLTTLGLRSWKAAFTMASEAMGVRAASFKNLRDEFDPMHGNSRRGWWDRPLRTSRQRVAAELEGISDDALFELVQRILGRESAATAEAIDALAPVTGVAAAVAERLLTGHRAEEFFVENAARLVGVASDRLIDCRRNACGYDFTANEDDARVFEVKGLKGNRGDILFTDREWSEAGSRSTYYVLVVVGRLESTPLARVFSDPRRLLTATCVLRQSVTATWRSSVSIAGRQ